jgi:hypothetical protein
MPKEAPLPAENPGYNGLARAPHTSLTGLAERYLLTQVASQAESTQTPSAATSPASSTSTPSTMGMITPRRGTCR